MGQEVGIKRESSVSLRALRVLTLPGKSFKGGNPYFRLFSEALEVAGLETVEMRSWRGLLGRFDVIHVHFPEHYITEQSLLGALKWGTFYLCVFLRAKLMSRAIIWSVHDVLPFKDRHNWLLKPYMWVVRRIVSGYVFMSKSSKAEFQQRFPQSNGKPDCLIKHGPFPVSDFSPATVASKRRLLSKDGQNFVVGFLGDIKRYKNILALRSIPRCLSDGRTIRVLIAGRADSESQEDVDITAASFPEDCFIRQNERLSPEMLDLLIRAVDVVILPYAKGWNSGLATLVFCNHGRVLGSSLPVFGDLVEEYGEPWVYQFQTIQDIPALLERIASTPVSLSDKHALDAKLRETDFSIGASQLREFYDHVSKTREHKSRSRSSTWWKFGCS